MDACDPNTVGKEQGLRLEGCGARLGGKASEGHWDDRLPWWQLEEGTGLA